MSEIVGKGYLGVILRRALSEYFTGDMSEDYAQMQEWIEYIEAFCKRHDYIIFVDKTPRADIDEWAENHPLSDS